MFHLLTPILLAITVATAAGLVLLHLVGIAAKAIGLVVL